MMIEPICGHNAIITWEHVVVEQYKALIQSDYWKGFFSHQGGTIAIQNEGFNRAPGDVLISRICQPGSAT
jgi:hypothetical protein